MSRHVFKGADPKVTVALGWDPPLDTFFLQVLKKRDGDEDLGRIDLMWLGTTCGEQRSPVALVTIARTWTSDIPEDMVATLYREEIAKPARAPAPWMIR